MGKKRNVEDSSARAKKHRDKNEKKYRGGMPQFLSRSKAPNHDAFRIILAFLPIHKRVLKPLLISLSK